MGDMIMLILKIVFFLLLLPLVFSTAVTVQDHLVVYPGSYAHALMTGLISFVLIYLFVYQFWGVYESGQKITSGFFRFAAPAEKILSYAFPFYMFIVVIFFYATRNWLGVSKLDEAYAFLVGFSLAMHLVLTAQDLQQQETFFFKPTYLFWMAFVFILNVFIFVGLMDLVVEKLTFPKFLGRMLSRSQDIYLMALKRFF